MTGVAPVAAASCRELLVGHAYFCESTAGDLFLSFSDQQAGPSFIGLLVDSNGRQFVATCTCDGKGPVAHPKLRTLPDFQCAKNDAGSVRVFSGQAVSGGRRILRGQLFDFGTTTTESTGAVIFECSQP